MKKMLTVILAAMISVMPLGLMQASAHTGHVNDGDTLNFKAASSSDIFGGLTDWTGIVFGNVNNIIDVEGTLAVGGSFNSARGLSVNGGVNGLNPASTEDVAFLVNDNAIINGYGNVWGQTVIGNAEGNTYHLSNVTPSDTTNGKYTVANTSKYFEDANRTAYSAKSAVEALPANGVCESAYGTYTFVGDTDADTLVYNVDDSTINSYLFDFTIAEGQTIIVNLTASGKIQMKNGAVRINGNMDPEQLRRYNRNIIINVVNSNEMEMTSCELFGIFLAPDTDLTGSNSDICGTSILNNLTGLNGFEIHKGYNDSFIPTVSGSTPEPTTEPATEPATEATTAPVQEETTPAAADENVRIRIDAPLKMAVAFQDGTICYGGEMKEFVVGQEYLFQMCSVNWENGIFDGNENGIRGTVVYRMKLVHQDEFNELAAAAKENTGRYIVKGIDIIDNETKTIIVNCDAEDAHLETDVNSFFVAYRFHFTGEDYGKTTGIDKVINEPIESLSVNLPAGSTITCNAFIDGEKVDSADVFITTNSGEGIYADEFLTSVNDYTWNK